jgi:glutathione S-transferase
MPKLTLYTSPRACSTACHIALEESGLDYDYRLVRIRQGETRRADYLAIHPMGKVPALEVDDEVLTETTAIMLLIAELAAPGVQLLPSGGGLARLRAVEWMSFLTSAVHLAFRPLFKPQQFTDDEALFPAIREQGGRYLRDMLLNVEQRLRGRIWALGDDYSVVDPYLFVFHTWSQRDNIRPHVAEMPNWMAHRRRVEDRAATRTVLDREGITADNITDP